MIRLMKIAPVLHCEWEGCHEEAQGTARDGRRLCRAHTVAALETWRAQ